MDSRTTLHHSEICVKDDQKMLNMFIKGLGFSLTHIRRAPSSIIYQWVIQSHEIRFILTRMAAKKNAEEDFIKTSKTRFYPLLNCCSSQPTHTNDRVFNIALEVKSVESVATKIKEFGSRVQIEPQEMGDEFGKIRYAVVESKCSNVIHTILNKDNYNGTFLPGFEEIENSSYIISNLELNLLSEFKKKCLTTYIDHVTYVCRIGESENIIHFYESCFGMRRFRTNRDETGEGFVLGQNIGLRLKAMQYWRCAESGVANPEDLDNPRNLKLVLAEPLPEVDDSHVKCFLRENEGPGVQHIGLYSSTMIETVSIMRQRGVPFRNPPSTYYEECGKLKEIQDVGLGEDLNTMRDLGILLDKEEESWQSSKEEKDSKKYLMQIFTHPIFDRDTFFLEVIERKGAKGFGAGNITALARSIQKFQEELKKKNLISPVTYSGQVD